MNILLITLDQFRGDCLSSAGHPLVQTPNLDALAAAGVGLRRHYSQATPCSPGRACLYTGTYQMNNRVVANGTPLDARFDNVAHAARRAGYTPTLFGYTDQSIDPRQATGPDDPRLSDYEEVLPGFEVELDLRGAMSPWTDWLRRPRSRRARRHRGGAGHRAETARRAQHLGLPHRSGRRLARAAGPGTLVRPPELPAPPPALRRGRDVGRPL